MNENSVEKNKLTDDELENVSGGALKLFEECVHEIQRYINDGNEKEAAMLMRLRYASLPKLTKRILAQQFKEKFHHDFTEPLIYGDTRN